MKKVIRKFLFIWIFCLALILGACGSKSQENLPEKSLYTHGLELISLMEEMAENEAYIDLYSGNPSIKEILSVVKNGDFTQPKAVYKLSLPDDVQELPQAENLSAPLKKYLQSKTPIMMVGQINGLSGALSLAAANICTAEKTFISNEMTEDTLIYLYTYENTVPVIVSFIAGENHTVSALGSFIFHEDLHTETPQDVEEFFKEISVKTEQIEL